MQNANNREVETRDTNTGKSPIGQISEILLVTAFILFLSSAVSASPTANFTYEINDLIVTFNSTSYSNHTLNCTYDFGDNTSANQCNIIHHYTNYGNYIVNLTVIDASNATLSDTITKNIEVKNKTEIKILFIMSGGIHGYYLQEAANNLTLDNTTIKLAIWNTDINDTLYLQYNNTPAPDPKHVNYNFTSFDIIAVYHLSYLPAIQQGLDEANKTGKKTIYLSESSFIWEVNVPQSIGKDAYEKYWVPSGSENHKRLLTYLAVELMDANETVLSGIKLPRSGIYHPDYKTNFQPCQTCLFNNLSSYFEWYNNQGKYHPENPTIGLSLSGYYYANGYNLADWIAIIREFEKRNVNVIPILDGTDMRWAFFNKTSNKTVVDIVVFYMGTTHGCKAYNLSSCEERKKVKAMLGVPWINGITISQTPEEWKNSSIGIPISYIGWAVAIQEMEGDIEPIVIGASVVDNLTQSLIKVPINISNANDNRVEYIVNRTLMWTNLKYMNNSEKKVAFIYYSYPPGKAEIGASYMDVPKTLEVLLNEMYGAGYYLGENFTKWNISDRNDSLSNNGSIVVKLITQGRNVGVWKQDDVDEMAKSGAVVLIPKEKYIQWFNEFPEDMRQDVIDNWGQPPGNQMVYNASNGSQYIVIPNIRYGNILLAPQPYRGQLNSEKTLYHNMSLPPNHQYIAFYLWLKKEFNASALVHVGTHGTLEWLPGKQVGLDRRSWPEALIQDFPNPYIYIVDNVGEGTQTKRRSYSVIIDHMTPPFIPAGLYGNYSDLHETIHHYLLAKDNNQTHLMDAYKNTSINIIKAIHMDEDVGINISHNTTLAEFESIVIYGKIHDYLHKIMYTNIPYGLRIFATQYPNESAVALVRQMMDISFVKHIQSINASCDFHDVSNYNETCSYKILWDYLINNASNGNYNIYYNDSNVSQDLLIAADYFNRITISSPNEIKGLLDSLDAKYVSPAIGGDVLRSPDVLPTGRNFYSFDPKTIPTKEACAIAKQTMDQLFVDYYERNGKFPEKMAFILWGIETMRNHGIPHCQMLYAMGVKPTWDAKGTIIYYSKKKPSDLHIMNESEMMLTLTNGTQILRPRIDVIGHSSGLHRDQFPLQMLLLDDAVRLVAQLNETDERNYIKKHSAMLKSYYITLINSTHSNLTTDEIESEAEKLSRSRLFAPPEGDYGVRVADPVFASSTWNNTDKIADQFIARSGNIYINGELYASPYVSGVDVFKETIKDTDAVMFIRSSNLYGVLDSDDPFQFMGGLSLAIARVSNGSLPEMWITNVRNKDNPEMQTLAEFINMEERTRMFNPNYIKGLMEHGYAGAGTLAKHVENLWGWDVVDTRFVDANDWHEVYEIYVQDKYDLGLHKFFNENSPWAEQSITARMMEAIRKGYWEPSDEVKKDIAQMYQKSVDANGPACCHHTCMNPFLNDFVSGILSTPTTDVNPSPSISPSHSPEKTYTNATSNASTTSNATVESKTDANATSNASTTSDAIVESKTDAKTKQDNKKNETEIENKSEGITGKEIETPKEQSKVNEELTGKKMETVSKPEEQPPAQTFPMSGIQIFALIVVIIVIAFVILGYMRKEK